MSRMTLGFLQQQIPVHTADYDVAVQRVSYYTAWYSPALFFFSFFFFLITQVNESFADIKILSQVHVFSHGQL